MAPTVVNHPTVQDTATLASGGWTIALDGIEGLDGEPAQGLAQYIVAHGDTVFCRAQADGRHVCTLQDGTDIALVSLANGAAEILPGAPEQYRVEQSDAQDHQRGVWASLPPPPDAFPTSLRPIDAQGLPAPAAGAIPITVTHPTVRDTATIMAASGAVVLFGIEGVTGGPAQGLQQYIAGRGDSLECLPRGTGMDVCTLPDGTDIAMAALVNGAARVGPDAPELYRTQQLDAQAHRRGIWADLTDPDVKEAQADLAEAPPPEFIALLSEDGISIIDGQPAVLVNDEPVYLEYGDIAGWGYWDHERHWHGAPQQWVSHLEQWHPHESLHADFRQRTQFASRGPIGDDRLPGRFSSAPGVRPELGRPGMGHAEFGRPAFGRPDFGRPGLGRPEIGGRPEMGRPGLGRPELGRAEPGRPELGRAGVGRTEPGHFQPPGRQEFRAPGGGTSMAMARPGMPPAMARPGMQPGMARPGMPPGMQPGMGRPGMVPGMARPGAPPMMGRPVGPMPGQMRPVPNFARPAQFNAAPRIAAPMARPAPVRTCVAGRCR